MSEDGLIEVILGSGIASALQDSQIRRAGAAPTALRLRDDLRLLAEVDQALDLRLARVLSHMRRMDMAELGFSSWSSFTREHISWNDSWSRDTRRLVDSGLTLVQQAVCRKLIPMSVAVLAPAQTTVEEQETWLVKAISGRIATRWETRAKQGGGNGGGSDVYFDDEAELIRKARKLARLCMGWNAPSPAVDEYIVMSWANETPGRVVLQQGRTAPPPPPRMAEAPPTWCDDPDPATRVLGPWAAPTDIHDGLKQVRQIEGLRASRKVAIARACQLLEYTPLYLDLGYDSMADFATHVFGISMRTVRRYKRLGWKLEWFPCLSDAIESGRFDLGRAELVAEVIEELTVGEWMRVAERTDVGELKAAVARAKQDVSGRRVLKTYKELLDEHCTGTENVAVAGVDPPPKRTGAVRTQVGHLLTASRWFVDTVVLPKLYGVAKQRDRFDYQCQNPRCRARHLRVQVHHLHRRADGGGDEARNLVVVCPSCHLRLIHGGKLTVVREDKTLLWRYLDGRPVRQGYPTV